MEKRPRRSFLRTLEQRYARNKGAVGPRARPGKPKKPVAYPLAVKPKQPRTGKGVIDMTVQQFVVLALFFVFLACAGSAGVAYGVVELTGGGEQGVQGVQGQQGPKGETGPKGPVGPADNDAAVQRLATLWAVQQLSVLQGGTRVELKDPFVVSCVAYVLSGAPDVGACPGFSTGE